MRKRSIAAPASASSAAAESEPAAAAAASAAAPRRPSYFLVARLYVRLLGLVFFAAFAGALFQNVALLGERGLLPACAPAPIAAT